MTDADAATEKQIFGSQRGNSPEQTGTRPNSAATNARTSDELDSLSENDRELFRELIQALRTIRYGSIVLIVHDGQVVEINKSIRIRKARAAKKE